jgi:hypothetical protein
MAKQNTATTTAPAPGSAFVYGPDLLDSDAANARSAAYRVIRDAAGLPTDDDKLTEEARGLHNAAGTSARNAANLVFNTMKDKRKREEWTPEQSEKVHTIMATEGIKAYRLALKGAGYVVKDDAIEAEALTAFKRRLVERRAQAEVLHRTQTGMGLDKAASDIFGG